MKATLRECWEARSRTCFWVSEQFSYRLGAVIAWCALRLGLHPNAITLLALAAGLTGVAIACWPGMDRAIGGVALVAGLLGSCALDCADGTVARLSGKSSGFGNVLDRIGDLTLSLVLAGALGVTALGQPGHWLPLSWQPFVLVWSLVPKQVLSVVAWLKDVIGKQAAPTRAPSGAARLNWFGRAKRLVGNMTDDAPYRFGVGLSWGLGWYFEFALIFHTILAAVTALYLFAIRRSFEATPHP